MISRLNTFFLALLATAWLLGAPMLAYANAETFVPIAKNRAVEMSGSLQAFNFETQQTSTAVFNDHDGGSNAAGDLIRMGMDIGLPDGLGFGQGVASQTLVADGKSIMFSGLADINVSAASAYPYLVEGAGAAKVSLLYEFEVVSAQRAILTMSSEFGRYREDDFRFILKSADGGVLWGQNGIVDGFGESRHDFNVNLDFKKGVYFLQVDLMAYSHVTDDVGFAGRTKADFSITTVPEPSALSMLLAAAGVVLLWRSRHVGVASPFLSQRSDTLN